MVSFFTRPPTDLTLPPKPSTVEWLRVGLRSRRKQQWSSAILEGQLTGARPDALRWKDLNIFLSFHSFRSHRTTASDLCCTTRDRACRISLVVSQRHYCAACGDCAVTARDGRLRRGAVGCYKSTPQESIDQTRRWTVNFRNCCRRRSRHIAAKSRRTKDRRFGVYICFQNFVSFVHVYYYFAIFQNFVFLWLSSILNMWNLVNLIVVFDSKQKHLWLKNFKIAISAIN